MINEKDFEQAIEKNIVNERGNMVSTSIAAAAVFELAKQMAKEQNAELLQALDKCVRYFEMHRNGGCNGEGRKPEAGSSYEVAKNLLAEYSGAPASSLAQEAEGKWTLEDLAADHPYYGTGSTGHRYATFQDFLDEMKAFDVDLNLCYRWDVAQADDLSYYAHLFTIQQRKGKIIAHHVDKFTEADIPLLIEYLKPHQATIQEMWKPFDFSPPSSNKIN